MYMYTHKSPLICAALSIYLSIYSTLGQGRPAHLLHGVHRVSASQPRAGGVRHARQR